MYYVLRQRGWGERRICSFHTCSEQIRGPDFYFVLVCSLVYVSVCFVVRLSLLFTGVFFRFVPSCVCLFSFWSLKVATFRTGRQTHEGPLCRAYLLNWSSEELLIVPLSEEQIRKSVCVMAPGSWHPGLAIRLCRAAELTDAEGSSLVHERGRRIMRPSV